MAELELTIPADNTTLDAKLYYCEVAREKLRREHNVMGQQFTDGKISEEQWETYLREEFSPKNTATSEAILAVRQVPKQAARALADDASDMQAVDLDSAFTAKEVTHL